MYQTPPQTPLRPAATAVPSNVAAPGAPVVERQALPITSNVWTNWFFRNRWNALQLDLPQDLQDHQAEQAEQAEQAQQAEE